MSEGNETYQLTPFAVAARALGAEQWAEDVLAELGKYARLGTEPGEIGVILFPADGVPYFDVADAPKEIVPTAEVAAEGGA